MAQWEHVLWWEIKEISKSNKIAPRKKATLELLHQQLGHESTI